jgi:galactonate dehydratase
VATAAALHLDACTPNFKIQEHFNDFVDDWVKGAVDEYPQVTDGYFSLPTRPGLGVTLREDFVAEHPRRDVTLNLFEEGWHRRQGIQG